MSERKRLLDLVDRAYRAHAWHGPSLLETLDGLTPALAAKSAVRGGHSVWGLVEHVASWNEIVAQRLEGKQPVVAPEFNFPKVPKPTPAAWKATLARLARTHAHFRRAVAAFPVAKLGRVRPKTSMTWSVLIHGQIQHQIWHGGQIAMMRRALGKPIKS